MTTIESLTLTLQLRDAVGTVNSATCRGCSREPITGYPGIAVILVCNIIIVIFSTIWKAPQALITIPNLILIGWSSRMTYVVGQCRSC